MNQIWNSQIEISDYNYKELHLIPMECYVLENGSYLYYMYWVGTESID